MNTRLFSSSLNSYLLSSSQIFSTHLTLSTHIYKMFLENLREVTRKCRAVAQKKERSWSSALRGPTWVRRFTTSAYITREWRGCRLLCSRSINM
jgi:hypothetical protein